MNENVVLIGFMAVGKGRTARELSRVTGRYTVDTDDLIESMFKMKIKKIFSAYGEPRFRELEQQTARWLADSVSGTIISTGGGFFTVPNLGDIGTVIYLHNEFDLILERIYEQPGADRKISKRPLLLDREKALRLYEQRLPLYRQAADHEYHVGNRTSAQSAVEIAELLGL